MYENLKNFYLSSEALVGCFIKLHESSDPNNVLKYQLRGSDLFIELCTILDVLKPLVDMVQMCNSVSTNSWNILDYLTKVKSILKNMQDALTQKSFNCVEQKLFPTLFKHKDELQALTFKGNELLDGWLLKASSQTRSKDGGKGTYSWVARENEEILQDLCQFTKDIGSVLEKRLANTFISILF